LLVYNLCKETVWRESTRVEISVDREVFLQ
jgi:hypothetical protein